MNKMVWSRLLVIFFVVSSLFFILPTIQNNSVKAFSGAGSGTVADPYQITDADELNETNDDLDANYTLMNDIDLSGCELWNGGKGFIPIGIDVDLGIGTTPFIGNFFGNNYTISNLFIDNTTGYYQGFFSETHSCIIKDIKLVDVDIVGLRSVAGFIGKDINSSISNCSVSGVVTGEYYIGGFMYSGLESSITDCFSTCNIYGSSTSNFGGFIGYAGECVITDCYATGAVVGFDNTGGFAGYSELCVITDCYASGNVNGDDCVGGLIGSNIESIIVDCTASGTVTYVTNGGWLIGCCTDCAGGLKINAYNESDGGSITFDISIFNSLGTLVYTNEDCTNTQWVNFTDMSPVAYNVTVIISSDGYNSRTYTATLYENMYITINSYLSTGGNSYLVRIIDEYLYPIDSASVSIKKYVSYTGTWTTITTFLTDGYGESFVTLLGNIDYKVTVSKTGYNTDVFDWHTDTIYFGPGYPKTFKISHSSNTINASNHFQDYITFTGTMYTNNTIKISYYDKSSTTTNTAIYLYELWNGVKILKRINTTSSNYNFYFWNTSINSSRTYIATLYWNSTTSYDITSPYSITLWPVNNTYNTSLSKIDIDKTVKDVIGPAPNGLGSWASIISVIIAMVLLTTLGPFNAALGIIGAGVGLGLTQALFGIFFTNSLSAGLILLCPFCIVIGIIYFMTKGNVEDKI